MSINKPRFKVVSRFFIPYILVLVLPVCIGLVLHNRTLKIVEKGIVDANLMTLEQGMRIMDNKMLDLDNLIYAVITDPKIKEFSFIQQPFNGSNVMRVLENKKQLERYKINNDFIIDSYILFKNNNVVFNSDNIYQTAELYGNFLSYDSYDYEAWYNKVLNQYSHKISLPAQQVTLRDRQYNVITYINSIGYSFRIQGAVLYLINSEYILSLFSGLDLYDGGWFYIEDSDGQIIYSSNLEAEHAQSKITEIDNDSGILHSLDNGNEMMVTYTTSSYNEWKYIVVQPMHIVNAKVFSLRQTSLAITFFYLLLGVLVSYILAYRNGKPIQDILGVIKLRLNMETITGHAYNSLPKTITALIDDKEELETRINEQIPYMRNTFFENLFRGEFAYEEEILAIAKHVCLQFDKRYYGIISLCIVGDTYKFHDNNLKDLDLLRFIVKDAVATVLGKEAYVHQSKADKIMILYGSNHEDKTSREEILSEKMTKVINEVNRQFAADIAMGVGKFYNSLMDISSSYNEANMALSLCLWKKNKNIVWYRDIQHAGKSYFIPNDIETRLINHINHGDKQSIDEVFTKLYRENFSTRTLPLYVMQLFVCNMYSILMSVMDKLSIQEEGIWNDSSMILQKIAHNKQEISDMYFRILEHYYCVCDLIEKRKNNHSEKLIEEIKDFINNSYFDSGFNLYAVADRFNMSQTYVSQFFKGRTGITFSEYLEKVRMNEAKRLLCIGKEPISVIAQIVGYSSISTFARAFKRRYGYSTREYKALQKGTSQLL